MKKIILFTFMISFGIVIHAFSQKTNIELTFSATSNSQNVILDSVYIENLTQGFDTTIVAPASSFVIINVGIADQLSASNGFLLRQNFPNPFKLQTSIDLFLPVKDHVKISVRNIMGQEVGHYENTLAGGKHTFTFYPGHEDYYIFTVFTTSVYKSIKMICVNTAGSEFKLDYSGYEGLQSDHKSIGSGAGFVFSFGDQLRYIAYAKTTEEIAGSDLIEDSPTNDQSYQFEISEGIPCREEPHFISDGQQYNTVQVGSQCWMKENLNIGNMINGTVAMTDNGITEKYCYNDNQSQCDNYGGLYQWDELMAYTTGQGTQGICPDGWHVPGDNDWTILTSFLGGDSIAGGKLKSAGTDFWMPPNAGATNASGFAGLPGGHRNPNGEFWNKAYTANFWSSTMDTPGFSWRWYIDFNMDDAVRISYDHTYAYSVRCIKDPPPWSCGEPFRDDRNKRKYNTVEIGTQCWMAENLEVAQYLDLSLIPKVTDNEAWANLTTGAWCYFDNEVSWGEPYGFLYNWYAVNDPRGLCPEGWHMPEHDEWTLLTDYIGGLLEPHANELKSCRQVNSPLGGICNTVEHPRWDDDQEQFGTDDYGFAALPGGFRERTGVFDQVGGMGTWWTATTDAASKAWFRSIYYKDGEINSALSDYYTYGFSVRCVKD